MQVEEYLKRIAYTGAREPTAETLKQLHRAHMFSIPFENLDIPLGNPIIHACLHLYPAGVCFHDDDIIIFNAEIFGRFRADFSKGFGADLFKRCHLAMLAVGVVEVSIAD